MALEGDRERLSFVEGEVPLYPLPEWVWNEPVLIDGARRLRQLHDASAGFGMDGTLWQSPSKIPAEVICHNDFAPHNLAFEGGQMIGAIDFDMCSPGPRLWDIAYFATRAGPLTRDPPPGAPGMERARARVQIILDAYGSKDSWADVLGVAVIRLWDLAPLSRTKAVAPIWRRRGIGTRLTQARPDWIWKRDNFAWYVVRGECRQPALDPIASAVGIRRDGTGVPLPWDYFYGRAGTSYASRNQEANAGKCERRFVPRRCPPTHIELTQPTGMTALATQVLPPHRIERR